MAGNTVQATSHAQPVTFKKEYFDQSSKVKITCVERSAPPSAAQEDQGCIQKAVRAVQVFQKEHQIGNLKKKIEHDKYI